MWSITKTDNGFRWLTGNSAYGAASGEAKTLAEAKVELAIAEGELYESPFPPAVVAAMRRDPVTFAADFPDPSDGGVED